LSCGDRALPLSQTPSGISFKGIGSSLKRTPVIAPFRERHTLSRPHFLYAFCALSIQLLRYRVPSTGYRVGGLADSHSPSREVLSRSSLRVPLHSWWA